MAGTKWESYEEVATFLLAKFASEFGLIQVEGKQKVHGYNLTGTEWEIDAKGLRKGNDGFIIVECRRYTSSRQSQEKLGGLAFRIADSGAKGGILVSPLGFQEGAKKVAAAANIMEVKLSSDSTPYEYFLEFLNKVMLGITDNVRVNDEVVVTKKG